MDERKLITDVADALRKVSHPASGTDIVAAGLVRGLRVRDGGDVEFRFVGAADEAAELADEARRAAESVAGVGSVRVHVEDDASAAESGRRLPIAGTSGSSGREGGPSPQPARAQAGARGGGSTPPQPERIPGIRHVVAVSSGKGGVGKSTVATNLAVALARAGHRVGLMDADVYGPDIPIMFGAYEKPRVTRQERVVPIQAHGVKLMSIGFLLDDDTPAIWRGPIVMGIIRQFLQQVDWGELEYLVVDMPPGTGDAQLSLVQLVKVDGGLLVTTPQGVATADVLKAIKMFERVEVPVLGLIENMSGFACPHCGERTELFGRGGGEKLAATAGVPFLGSVPLGTSVVQAGDTGRPTVASAPDSPEAEAFVELAAKVAGALAEREAKAQA